MSYCGCYCYCLCKTMIYQLQINGGPRLFLFESLHRYSTNAAVAPPSETPFLVDYLIKSLGLSKDEALSATQKVTLWESSRNDPDLVINFLQNLGLNKTQIRSIVSAHPRLPTSNVEKTLQPKIQVLQDLGMSGSDLIEFLLTYKSFLTRALNSEIRPPVESLRNLLDSDENVVRAIKKSSSVIEPSAPRAIASNVKLLQKIGLSAEDISRLILHQPRKFERNPERLEKVLYKLENDFGISRDSRMFYHGIVVLSSFCKSTVDKKFGVFRSFGWSDATIYMVFRKYPYVISTSENKLRKVWNFFTTELWYRPNYLATHPSFFNLNFERRVKLRSDVMKILNEKKLNKRKGGLATVLLMKESKFINNYLLPYKNEIPDLFDSYFKIRRAELGNL